MNNYEKKYGIKESEKTKKFHKNRRMFAIKNELLYFAPVRAPYSHAEWFEKKGWISVNDYSKMDSITRGCINESGIYVYRGWDFAFNSKDISILLKKLPKIIDMLGISKEKHLYGGMIRDSKGEFIPIRDFGTLSNLINT